MRHAAYGLALAGLFFVGGADVADAKKKKRMTCSFIAKQCLRGCVKEAPGPFCSTYCSDTRAACLQTGQWNGIRRRFTNVRRR